MNETIFSVATALISFIIPVAFYKIWIRKNKTGRDYYSDSGRYASRGMRFVVFVVSAIISSFIAEPIIYAGLYNSCLESPNLEFGLLLMGIVANYFLIDYLS